MYVACYRVANTDMHALHAICNHDHDDDWDEDDNNNVLKKDDYDVEKEDY